MEVFNNQLSLLEQLCPVKMALMQIIQEYSDDRTMMWGELYEKLCKMMPGQPWRNPKYPDRVTWELLIGAFETLFTTKTLNDLADAMANSQSSGAALLWRIAGMRYVKAELATDAVWQNAWKLAREFKAGPLRPAVVAKIENSTPSGSEQASTKTLSNMTTAQEFLNRSLALRTEIINNMARMANSNQFEKLAIGFNESAGVGFTSSDISGIKSNSAGMPVPMCEELLTRALQRKYFTVEQLAGVFKYAGNEVLADKIRAAGNGQPVTISDNIPLTAAMLSPPAPTPAVVIGMPPAAANIPGVPAGPHVGGFVMTDDAQLADYLLVKRGANGKPEVLWQLDKQNRRVVFTSLAAARRFRLFLEKKKALTSDDKWAVMLLLGTSQGEEFVPSEVERVAEIEGEDEDADDDSTDDVPTRTVTNLTSTAKPLSKKIEYIGSDGVVRTAGENTAAFQRYIVASMNPNNDAYTFYPAPPGKEPANDAAAETALEVIAEAESKSRPDDVFGLYQVVEQSKEKRATRTMKRAALVNEPRGSGARSAK